MSDHTTTPEEIEREHRPKRSGKRHGGQLLAIAALGAGALWLLRQRNRHRTSGVRAAVRWLIANPTALTTGASLLSFVMGLLVPGSRREAPRSTPPATTASGGEMRQAVLDDGARSVEQLRHE